MASWGGLARNRIAAAKRAKKSVVESGDMNGAQRIDMVRSMQMKELKLEVSTCNMKHSGII